MVELLVDDLPYLVVGLVFLKEFVESLPVSHDRTRLDVLNNFLVEQHEFKQSEDYFEAAQLFQHIE